MIRRILIALVIGALDFALIDAAVFGLDPQMYVETAGSIIGISALLASIITFAALSLAERRSAQ